MALWKTTFFGPKFFGEKDPQNQMRTFYAPIGTHQVGQFGAILPQQIPTILAKVALHQVLANFQISGVKKLLGQ